MGKIGSLKAREEMFLSSAQVLPIMSSKFLAILIYSKWP